MSYFKIYNGRRGGWWRQDSYGYTPDENEAGWWRGDAEKWNNERRPDDEEVYIAFEPTALQLRLRQRELEIN